MKVVGIDPGLNGALALVDDVSASVYDLPLCKHDGVQYIDAMAFVEHFKAIIEMADYVVVEEQGPRPYQGARHTFRHGCEYGRLLGALEALGVDPLFVHPKRWKAEMGLSADKEQSLEAARRMWPELEPALRRKRHDGRAEALLIAWYARRVLSTHGASAFTQPQDSGSPSPRRRGSGRKPSRRNSGRSPASRRKKGGKPAC